MKNTKNKLKRKRESKRKRKKILRVVLLVIFGYPIYFPLKKLGAWLEDTKGKYWMKRMDRLKGKSIKEAISYIERDSVESSSYFVYNHYPYEDILYGNALYVHDFFSFHSKNKNNYYSSLYYDLVWRRAKKSGNIDFSSDEHYKEMYESLKEGLQTKYKDISVDFPDENVYGKHYECFKVTMDS